ncbi:regulator of chromosome condensation 1/beta-lactamase-inhibitor protein II [Cristinia sonorae]|uniref:Regulator of chromosome condensation 1/beta-lactamase-inhibitor protein II n=1 Tax=Cristinia sonorae TaxID=1940300 RepID=A0A8K0UNE6_9AGAR|nr:regulator of chromosome condensation 1/beta-lactamase-inhibitor protein II [Cristinia sonorae]
MPSPKSLLSAGSNARGQLAIHSLDDAYTFTPTSFQDFPPGDLPTNTLAISQVACGSNFTLLLLDRAYPSGTRRELWASGDGSRGQLGPTYARDRPPYATFVPVDLRLSKYGLGEYSFHSIAAGWETSFVVLKCPGQDDVLASFGANDFGDLGIGSTKNDSPPDFGHIHKVDVKSFGEAVTKSTVSIDFVSAGTHHVVVHATFTYSDGRTGSTLIGWGTSRHGQLGTASAGGRPPSIQPSPVAVEPLGSTTFSMASAGSQHTSLLHSSGSSKAIGSNRKGQISGVDSLTNVTSIGSTWNGTYVVLEYPGSWSIMATGDNAKGQLGCQTSADQRDGTLETVYFPFTSNSHKLLRMACGSEHVVCLFSILADNKQCTEVWGWGWNEHGNLGLGHTDDLHLPTKIWPNSGDPSTAQALDVWGGCGTTWILVAETNP